MTEAQTIQSVLLAHDIRLFPEPPTGIATTQLATQSPNASDWSSSDNKIVAKASKRQSKRSSNFYAWKGAFAREIDAFGPVKNLELLVQSLQMGLENERQQRQYDASRFSKALQRVYDDFAARTDRQQTKISSLDKMVTSIAGEQKDYKAELRSLKTMSERMNRLESIENQSLNMAPSFTSNAPNCRSPSFKTSSERIWGAQVIFVLDAAKPNVVEAEGVPFLKLQSRRASQYIFFSGDSSLSFSLGIEGSFVQVLRGRTWMPLASQKLPERRAHTRITLDCIPQADRDSSLWDHAFLSKNCIVKNKSGKDHLYIALQNEQLSWPEVEAGLPKEGVRDSQLGVLDRIASQAFAADEPNKQSEPTTPSGRCRTPNSPWKPRHRELLDSPIFSQRSSFQGLADDAASAKTVWLAEKKRIQDEVHEMKKNQEFRTSTSTQKEEKDVKHEKSNPRCLRSIFSRRGKHGNDK